MFVSHYRNPHKTTWHRELSQQVNLKIISSFAKYTNAKRLVGKQDSVKVGWSLTSLFSTNTAISETKDSVKTEPRVYVLFIHGGQ